MYYKKDEIYYYTFDTLLGEMTVWEENGALIRLDIGAKTQAEGAVFELTPLLRQAKQELEEYLEGKRTSFDLPLNPQGTAFQREVWEKMCQIPYGETKSYGELAEAIGRRQAQRAVGGACHQNPIPIIIPCHRVLAKGGLGGFGLGTEMKKILLRQENPACIY